MCERRFLGLAKCENANQGSFIIDELTELVDEAVLQEFEAINEGCGALGAMEPGYLCGKIGKGSVHYEHLKHAGDSLGKFAIIGVNTFRNPQGDMVPQQIELARSTEEEKQSQLMRLHDFHHRRAGEAPVVLERPKRTVIDNGNVFAVLLVAVRCCSPGKIRNALIEVGMYRRNTWPSLQLRRSTAASASPTDKQCGEFDSNVWHGMLAASSTRNPRGRLEAVTRRISPSLRVDDRPSGPRCGPFPSA
jgi:hypothetical protein